MNNRYIFRGKREKDEQWEYGAFWQKNSSIIDKSGYSQKVIPETVGQCTGLKDKNGKPMFEGDVVKADGYIFIVKFGKCGGVANDENYGYMGYYLDGFDSMTKDVLRFGLRNDICYFTDIEVIGNIHDDDLLEVER